MIVIIWQGWNGEFGRLLSSRSWTRAFCTGGLARSYHLHHRHHYHHQPHHHHLRYHDQGTRTNKEPGSWHNLALISEGGQQQDSYSMVLTGLQLGDNDDVDDGGDDNNNGEDNVDDENSPFLKYKTISQALKRRLSMNWGWELWIGEEHHDILGGEHKFWKF